MSDNKKQNKPNVPNLRFPEFSGEWCLRRLEECAVFLDDQRKPIKSSDRINKMGLYPYYGASGEIDRVDDFIFDDNLVLLSEDGANIIDRNYRVAFIINGKTWVNNHAHVLKPKQDIDLDFLSESLERLDYAPYNTGTTMPKLNQEICRNIKISVPSYKEQKKIGYLLSLLNNRIAIQSKVIKDLKSLYDVICQKLYSPNDKLGWQEFKYSDLFTISNERNSRLQYTNVLSASQEYGMVERGELNIDIKYDATSIKNYKIVHPNEYVIHLRSFQGGFAYSDKTGICSPAYTILVPNGKLIPAFLKYYFTSTQFINSLRIVTYGIRDGRSISVEELLQLKISIPTISEQHYILSVMQLWEEKIRIEECHLSNLQKQKQYLLRQMFI